VLDAARPGPDSSAACYARATQGLPTIDQLHLIRAWSQEIVLAVGIKARRCGSRDVFQQRAGELVGLDAAGTLERDVDGVHRQRFEVGKAIRFGVTDAPADAEERAEASRRD
jgi:hypothetical protein